MAEVIFQIRHTIRVSCPVLWTDILIVRVRGKPVHATMEVSHKDPIILPTMDPKNWTKNFEPKLQTAPTELRLLPGYDSPFGCSGSPDWCRREHAYLS